MTGNSKWRLSFWPVLAFVVMLPLLISLGLWQVERGFEKRETYTQFAQASNTVPDKIDPTRAELAALPMYRRIRLQGHYLRERQFLLDNMSRDGRPGHHVLTPFIPEGKDYAVIVDRGWRAGLAADNRTEIGVDDQSRTVVGMLAPLPRPALQLEGRPALAGDWPRVAQFPSAQEMAEALDMQVAEPRLLLDASEADGFRRDWQPPGIPPARHFGYAFQWFALATALIVIFFVMARPRRAEADNS